MTTPGSRVAARIALAIGVALLLVAIHYTDWTLVRASGRRLLLSIAASIALSGVWHMARTVAWAWCFSSPSRVRFARLFRVRMAAEAVSYVTLRGVAGEPLKVVLLAGDVDAREATAAVALERLAYLVGTAVIVGAASLVALATLPLSRIWVRVFGAFAAGAGAIALLTIIVLAGEGTYLGGLRRASRGSSPIAVAGRFIADVETHLLQVAREHPGRLLMLAAMTATSYVLMSLEAFAILRLVGIPVSLPAAVAIETFSRVASFASSVIPANLGALEAASLAATAAAGVAGGGPLALARRVRGLFWASVGFTIYPRGARTTAPRPRAHARSLV